MKPKDYYSTHMVAYERPRAMGFLCLDILPFLIGKPWNEVALGFVHSVRPSSIRVTTGLVKCDARTWRVTVVVDEKDIITEITQEVEVGLPHGVSHGDALSDALCHGLDSEQVKWHDDKDENLSHYFADETGEYKVLDDGTQIKYPEP